jgi:hypothetical protein
MNFYLSVLIGERRHTRQIEIRNRNETKIGSRQRVFMLRTVGDSQEPLMVSEALRTRKHRNAGGTETARATNNGHRPADGGAPTESARMFARTLVESSLQLSPRW